MALRKGDISLGAVAYLDYAKIIGNPDIQQIDSNLDRDGPFVCIQWTPVQCTWTIITKVHRDERLLLQKDWKLNGSDGWRNDAQYLCDGRNTFIGTHAAFVAAGAGELPMPYRRPKLRKDGLDAILERVKARGGALL